MTATAKANQMAWRSTKSQSSEMTKAATMPNTKSSSCAFARSPTTPTTPPNKPPTSWRTRPASAELCVSVTSSETRRSQCAPSASEAITQSFCSGNASV